VDGVFRLDDIANGVSSVPSSSLQIFPNPGHDNIFIQDDLNEVKEIKIFDATGKLLRVYSLNGIGAKKISIQDFSPGIYYAEMNGRVIRLEKQ